MKVQIIAHRGVSAISPENTMVAFRRAVEIGANAIETDVQMTRDGQLVLIHDEKLERTTNGTGWVKDYTLDQLKTLDAGSWFSPIYKEERIPTVDELFQLIAATSLWVNLEIKMGFIMYPGIEEKLVEKIKEYKMEKRVIISSFNHYSVARVKALAKEMDTAILYSEGLYEPWKYARNLGANHLHPHKDVVFPELIVEAHKNGMKVFPYTIDAKDRMLALIEMGVDGIITNVPDRLILLLRSLSK